jgi:hypothetical protein
MKTHSSERGIALLITLLIMTVLLGVSSSLLNITLKQFQFSAIGLQSEMAFQAANAGMECLMWHDYETYTSSNPASKFDFVQSSPQIRCMGSANVAAYNTSNPQPRVVSRSYRFTWGSPQVCSDVTIFKFDEPASFESGDTLGPDMKDALRRSTVTRCAEDVVCTVIQARGYNVPCPIAGQNFPARTIERELTQRY